MKENIVIMSKIQGRNPFRSARSGEAGFTLIELMVVVAIIAILAAIGIPTMATIVRAASSTEAVDQMGRISKALRGYVDSHLTMTGSELTTAINVRDSLPGSTGTALSELIPHLRLPTNAKFTYRVDVAVSDAGDINACIRATGTGSDTAALLYSETLPTTNKALWEEQIYRTAYVNKSTDFTGVSGGDCTTARIAATTGT